MDTPLTVTRLEISPSPQEEGNEHVRLVYNVKLVEQVLHVEEVKHTRQFAIQGLQVLEVESLKN